MGQLKEEMDRLKEEIKKLEPFESRARVLEEEVTKLIVDLRVFEQKSVDARQKEKDAQASQKEAEDRLKQREEEIAKERRAIEDDLPWQFEARFEKAKLLFGHLFADRGLDFDQVGPWHKLENGNIIPPFDDEDEDDRAAEDCPTEN